ncbi:hypothetical protein G9A89_017946 [Geosiphon pyriformis]|nr:hypothetical protein G9A89_017946 [Geosiphon pyriformis]
MILIPENINNITQQLVESLQQLKSDLEITVNSSKITYIKRTIENPKTRKKHNFKSYNIAKYNNKFISKVIEKLEIALGNTLYSKDSTRRNTSGNCKDSLRKDPRQWVDFSSASEKEYINTHNNQELKNNLHCNSKKKVFSVTVILLHK